MPMFRFFSAGKPAVMVCVIFLSCWNMQGQQPDLQAIKAVSDTTDVRRDSYFKPTQLILPVSLIAVGSFGVCNGTFGKLNNGVRENMACMRGDHYFHADDYIQYLPAVAYLGMGFTGVKTKNSFKERLAAGLTAYAAMAAIVNITKYSVKEKRPDSGARNSFPSGHTATAFTGAELIREEYGNLWGAGAYVVATGVAFLRLYNDRHWLNDVIAGVGIGILSARIGYWMLPLYRKWFHWDRSRATTLITAMPAYSSQDHSLALTVSIIL